MSKNINIQINPKEVFIAAPIHYDPTAHFTRLLIDLSAALPGVAIHILPGDSHPDRARNRCVDEFLKSGRQWLLFLDADLCGSVESVARLFYWGEPMVCGFYAAKRPGKAKWIANREIEATNDERGLIPLREGGTGFMLINRKIFDALIEQKLVADYIPDPGDQPQTYHWFASGVYFDEDVKRNRWLSEDWAFCRIVRKAGFRIWGDPNAVLQHEGRILYPYDPAIEAKKAEEVKSE